MYLRIPAAPYQIIAFISQTGKLQLLIIVQVLHPDLIQFDEKRK